MKVLVTGSAGHLGEALVRTLKNLDYLYKYTIILVN